MQSHSSFAFPICQGGRCTCRNSVVDATSVLTSCAVRAAPAPRRKVNHSPLAKVLRLKPETCFCAFCISCLETGDRETNRGNDGSSGIHRVWTQSRRDVKSEVVDLAM